MMPTTDLLIDEPTFIGVFDREKRFDPFGGALATPLLWQRDVKRF